MVQILIVAGYLVLTTLVGLYQSQKVKKTQQFTVSRMSLWQAATFLAGFTLGGGATYGVAGDTIKFEAFSADGCCQATTNVISNFNAAPPTSIPTLSEWGMMILSSLLALGTVLTLRRQRQ